MSTKDLRITSPAPYSGGEPESPQSTSPITFAHVQPYKWTTPSRRTSYSKRPMLSPATENDRPSQSFSSADGRSEIEAAEEGRDEVFISDAGGDGEYVEMEVEQLGGGGGASQEANRPARCPTILRKVLSHRNPNNMTYMTTMGSSGDGVHSYSNEEKMAFAAHINGCLKGDPQLRQPLPVEADGSNLFEAVGDGLIICKLINKAHNNTINEAKLNVGKDMGIYRRTENCNVAILGAKKIGITLINIGAQDIIAGKPTLVLSLLWQIIKLQLLSQISLEACPDLVHLMEEGEQAFWALTAEQILMRWFNHHLEWAGSDRRIRNFGKDLADSVCYTILLHQLHEDTRKIDPTKGDPIRRAEAVIRSAAKLGVKSFIRAPHITSGNKRLNLAFVAQIFNTKPRIRPFQRMHHAAVRLQSWRRMSVARQAFVAVADRRQEAASRIQRWWRLWHTVQTKLFVAAHAEHSLEMPGTGWSFNYVRNMFKSSSDQNNVSYVASAHPVRKQAPIGDGLDKDGSNKEEDQSGVVEKEQADPGVFGTSISVRECVMMAAPLVYFAADYLLAQAAFCVL